MRKIFLLYALAVVCAIYAQVPRWMLHPVYDHVRMLGNGFYVVSKDGRLGMMDAEEKEVLPLEYDSISVFNSHHALLYADGKCVGYVSDQAQMRSIKELECDIVGVNRFSCGYLAMRNEGGYFFINASDGRQIGPYSGLTAFCEDYAWVKIPDSPKHILDGSYSFDVISAKDGKSVSLSLGDFEKDDIDFVSSCSNGKCIMVLKKRFYEYDYKSKRLSPLSTDNNPDNKKSRVLAMERPVLVTADGNGYKIRFKQGIMKFDMLMRLTSITYEGQPTILVEVPKEGGKQHESPIAAVDYAGTSLKGLSCNGKDVLPAQFDGVDMLWGYEALVRQRGKHGVLVVDPERNCRFVLNDNRNIGFEHSSVNTNVKVVSPPYMNPRLMSMSSLSEDCTINVDTREENVNVESAVLSYDCTLRIPEKIELKPTLSSLKFSLNYDGLKFMPAVIPFDTWYINNYSVQMLSSQVTGSVLNVEVVVKNNGRRDTNYFCDVQITPEDSTIYCQFTKVNEELYTARFYEWTEDIVRFNVQITEEGCPTLLYPYEVPVKSTKTSNKGSRTRLARGTSKSEQSDESTESSFRRHTNTARKSGNVILISPK